MAAIEEATGFEWVGDNLWLLWLTLAVVFAVVEVMVLDLVFLMLAAGAAAALATALAGGALLPGRIVLALEDTGSTAGLAKMDGETWTARSATGEIIPAGQEAEVEEVDGATLILHPRTVIDWDAGPAGLPEGT